MSTYDFVLPDDIQFDPESRDALQQAAQQLRACIPSAKRDTPLPAICDNGEIILDPTTNNHWLCPPNCTKDTHPKGKWRITGRYEAVPDLKRYINLWIKSIRKNNFTSTRLS